MKLFAKTLVAGAATAIALVSNPTPAAACGGFFCNGGGASPVVQAAERVIFEQMGDGMVRASVHIQYNQQGGVPIGFSWVVPVMDVPEIGVADPQTFNELDAATAPQFRFVSANRGVSSGGGGVGFACGASDALASGAPESADDGGVTVWDESRVGDYETAVISADSAEEILRWLEENEYDIPSSAEDTLEHYVFTNHVFAAFRYNPIGPGSGNLQPITLTYRGEKPCVPLRITAIASVPVLDVMVLTFGGGRARPEGEFVEVTPDYSAVRQDFAMPNGTTYMDEVDEAIAEAGGYGWVVEHASGTADLFNLADPDAVSIAERNPYVTRFYTRLPPERMDIDPEFLFTSEEADVNRLHVIDLTNANRSPDVSAAREAESDSRFASAPIVGFFGLTGLTLFARRRRRR